MLPANPATSQEIQFLQRKKYNESLVMLIDALALAHTTAKASVAGNTALHLAERKGTDNMDQQEALEQQISMLEGKLHEAKEAVRSWTEANAALSRSAAEARAKNQGAGRGIVGAFLGAKFRSAVRSGAAASNAAISKEVADKRQKIAEGKQAAQDAVRSIQQAISDSKAQLKQIKSSKSKESGSISANKKLDILQKLKRAHDDGLLTAAEYEEKRKKISF